MKTEGLLDWAQELLILRVTNHVTLRALNEKLGW